MRILIIICLFLMAAPGRAQSISHIGRANAWYYIYDQDGKSIKTISTSQGVIVAHGTSFYILKQGSTFYIIYDVNGRRITTLSVSNVGEVIAASGDTFTSRNGGWIYTWDKNAKRINTR